MNDTGLFRVFLWLELEYVLTTCFFSYDLKLINGSNELIFSLLSKLSWSFNCLSLGKFKNNAEVIENLSLKFTVVQTFVGFNWHITKLTSQTYLSKCLVAYPLLQVVCLSLICWYSSMRDTCWSIGSWWDAFNSEITFSVNFLLVCSIHILVELPSILHTITEDVN